MVIKMTNGHTDKRVCEGIREYYDLLDNGLSDEEIMLALDGSYGAAIVRIRIAMCELKMAILSACEFFR